MDNLTSIVIPVYNVERYLSKCIDSVIQQTYKNIEIILVDDGSTDTSPSICDEYGQLYKNIRVIHKTNGGLSSARNAGLKIANGDFIGFIDSDDFIHPDMYNRMMSTLMKHKADLCICSYEYVDSEDKPMIGNVSKNPIKDEVLTPKDAQRKLSEDNGWYYVTAVNKLYKKSLFENIRFIEGRLHEDEFLIHHVFDKCNLIVTISTKLYFYVQRQDGIMGTKVNIRHFDASLALIDRYYLYKKKYPKLSKMALKAAYSPAVSTLHLIKYRSWSKEYKDTLFKLIKLLLLEFDLRAIKLTLLVIKNY